MRTTEKVMFPKVRGFSFSYAFSSELKTATTVPDDDVKSNGEYVHHNILNGLFFQVAIIGNSLIVISSPWLSPPITPYLRLCISLAAADMWAASLLTAGYFLVIHNAPFDVHGRVLCGRGIPSRWVPNK